MPHKVGTVGWLKRALRDVPDDVAVVGVDTLTGRHEPWAIDSYVYDTEHKLFELTVG